MFILAACSFPVPLSPMSITAIEVGATVLINEYIRVERGLRPSTVLLTPFSPLFVWRPPLSLFFSLFLPLRAASIFSASIDGLIGFSRKSKAPSFIAETAVWISPYPVMIMTGSERSLSFIQESSMMPSPSGRRRSDKTMSYAERDRDSCADTIPVHHFAEKPFFSNHF
jgi:hypothetical protein